MTYSENPGLPFLRVSKRRRHAPQGRKCDPGFVRPVLHAAGVFFPGKRDDPGFSKHVISEKSQICVLFSLCTLCSMPQALFFPPKKPILDFPSMSFLRSHRFVYFLEFAPCAACLPVGNFPTKCQFVGEFSTGRCWTALPWGIPPRSAIRGGIPHGSAAQHLPVENSPTN